MLKVKKRVLKEEEGVEGKREVLTEEKGVEGKRRVLKEEKGINLLGGKVLKVRRGC